MLPTGIVRKIDNVGRVVLPTEIRRQLNLTTDTQIQIYLKDSYIVVEKVGCLLCGNEDVIQTEAGLFCRECQAKIGREIQPRDGEEERQA